MPCEIRVPRLGWSMEEGTFVRWLKGPGDRVKAGEALFELEGEKSVEPVESIDAGILCVPPEAPAAGTVVKVGACLGWLLADGETAPATLPTAAPAPSAPPVARVSASPPPAGAPARVPPHDAAGPGSHGTGTGGPSSPAIRRLARELGIGLERVAGSGRSGRIVADDVYAAAVAGVAAHGAGARRISTPRARATAARLGVDWRTLAGSGRGGRIREADVLGAPREGSRGASGSAAPSPRLAGLPPRRRAIAAKMLESCRETAPVTLHARADAGALLALRARLKGAGIAPVPAFTDLLAKLVAPLLLAHRELAARWDEATGALEYPEVDGVHVGVAVDTPAGLLVPVVRDVGRRSLAEVAADARRLVEKARGGGLSAADMRGGVFTITNLGMSRTDAFTPIINFPEAAILGVAGIRREPGVVRGPDGVERVAIRDVVPLSLTFDHVRIDGAPAARFLDAVCLAIEEARVPGVEG